MRTTFATCLLAMLLAVTTARAAEMPAHGFRLIRAEVDRVDRTKSHPGAMFAAAVLYAKKHPANPSLGDRKLLDLALTLGDRLVESAEADKSENKQDYEWEIHAWLDTYRLLEAELGLERRMRWRRALEPIVSWFAGQTAARLDFPRYQGPYIHTSTNHLSIFASTVYCAGKILGNREWETLGAKAMHRLAAEEQTPDGYWGELTDAGPATNYNYLTMSSVALYYEHSGDKAAYDALRRATDFHRHFTWPDGTPVETINGRNRYGVVSPTGTFGFTHWPDGRGYGEFLMGFFPVNDPAKPLGTKELGSKALARLVQSVLYWHDGPTEKPPQELANYDYRMKVEAGIRKTGPWSVCLSGLVDPSIDSQFTLDRQGHVSVFHSRHGLIITGAGSRNQPELATFTERTKTGALGTIPLSGRLRMSTERDRLGLGYRTFFAEAEVPTPIDEKLAIRFTIVETGRNQLREAELHLQLCLKAGETLETATTKIVLDEKRIDLDAEHVGGWIRHRGWKLTVDPKARLTWPVLPFNPYKNAPETDMSRAIGVVSVPVRVDPPNEGALNWRRGEIGFVLELK
jgi:hypothetical protein